jgi:hypothetical protein
LYDFSAQVGDFWVVPEIYESGCDSVGRVNVISVGDTLINSEVLRYIVVAPDTPSDWIMQGLVVEKIGPIDWYMLPEQNCMTDLMEGGPLRCYYDPDFDFSTDIAPYCDFTVGINEADLKNGFSIFPNPAVNTLKINCPTDDTYHLSIKNIFGKTVWESNVITDGERLDVSGFSSGIYIVCLTDNQSISKTLKLQIINN